MAAGRLSYILVGVSDIAGRRADELQIKMRVAILGYGLQGRSAYKHYLKLGCRLTVCDQNEALKGPAGAELKLGETYLENLERFDLLVRTSSLPPEKIVAANGGRPAILEKATTTSNEFLRLAGTPVIAITGTKGKGTTSLLSEALLKAAGLKVCLAGNIGVDVLERLEKAQRADVVVFEIASYQTVDLRCSPQVGVALKITPDHINWHGSFEAYSQAKARLFAHQTPKDKAVYFLGNRPACRAVEASPATKVGYDIRDNPKARVRIKAGRLYLASEPLMSVSRLALEGEHNRENVCAAVAACEDFLPKGPEGRRLIVGVLSRFGNLENRLEFVRELRGVRYINDSSATNPQAALAALRTVEGPKILIAGGLDKGIPMEELFEGILSLGVKHLVAIGPTGPVMADFLRRRSAGFSIEESCETMAEMMASAVAKAVAGDSVLLSPGYASHAYFGNASVRARRFKEEVARLR